MYPVSARMQNHQFNTLIKCSAFLQVSYLKIATTFSKPLILKWNQSNIQAHPYTTYKCTHREIVDSTESLRQLKWLWSKSSQEEYATNGVTILHKQHCKVSRYSVSCICKDAKSPVQHSHQVFCFLTSQLSKNYINISWFTRCLCNLPV